METVLEGGDGRDLGVRSGRAAADRAGALSAPLGGCLATTGFTTRRNYGVVV